MRHAGVRVRAANDVIHGAIRSIRVANCTEHRYQHALHVQKSLSLKISGTKLGTIASISPALSRSIVCLFLKFFFSTVVIPRQGVTLISQDTKKKKR